MDQNNEQPKQPKSDDSTQPQLHIEIKEGAFEGNQGQVNIGSKVKNIYNHVHKKVKKNPKLSLIVGGCLVVLLILLIISTASSSEAEAANAIDKFENAIVMEDIETLKDMISVDTAEMGIKDEYLKQLCDYAKKNPDYLTTTIDLMNAQKSLYEGQDAYGSKTLRQRSNQDIMSSGEFYLKKDEGIFSDSYIIGVRPQYLEITFKSNQGLIKVDGKEVWKVNKNQNKKKIGPLFPGNHKVYVESYFSYANMTLKEEHQENLLGLSQTTEARYELTGSGIKATSKHAGVQVYMNNQKTPFIIYVGNGDTTVYPVKYDGSQTIYGVAKYPWGESKKSKSIRIDDASKEYDVTPPLFPSAKAKESFMDVLKAFGEDRAKVLTTKNPGHYRNIHPKHKKDIEETWKEEKEGYALSFSLNPVIQNGSATFKEMKVRKNVEDEEMITVFYSTDTKEYRVRVNVDVIHKVTYKDYHDPDYKDHLEVFLKYQNGKWYITNYKEL